MSAETPTLERPQPATVASPAGAAPAAERPVPVDLTVYYDGACPVCSREIAVYRAQPGAEQMCWVDVAAVDPSSLSVPGQAELDQASALARLHVRKADGSLVAGAAAFQAIWLRLPRMRWLARWTSGKAMLAVLNLGYEALLLLRPLWRRPLTSQALARAPEQQGRPQHLLDAETIADLRSDHAGETGAVWIYRGILTVGRDPELRAFAEHHLQTEQRHLQAIEAWLPPRRRSRLLPLWRVSGALTGLLPAVFGPPAVYRTIQAVETFVDQHYQHQVDRLASLPALASLRQELESFRADEVAHRDDASGRLPDAPGPVARAWAWVVGTGSAVAVAVCRRF